MNRMCANHILLTGTEEQKKKYLVPLAQRAKLDCWSVTGSRAGSDAGGTRTTAEIEANTWILNGSRTFTTNTHYADICVSMTVTDRMKGNHGISAFIIEKGMLGFRPGKMVRKLGIRANDAGELFLKMAEFPKETACRNPAMDLSTV